MEERSAMMMITLMKSWLNTGRYTDETKVNERHFGSIKIK